LQLRRRAAVGLALVVLVATDLPARAEDSFVAKTQIYTDNDHTTVVSPLVGISRDAWSGGTVSASYVADIVSSASVDVISNATKRMSDFRSEITAGLRQKLRSTTLTGAYIYSVEHDYQSQNVSLGLAQDLAQHNTTLALGYTTSIDLVGRAGDQSFRRLLLVNGVAATWTQTLTTSTIAQLEYSFAYGDGYMASPYRFVRVDAMPETASFKVPETDPGQRLRHAFVIGANQHLFTDTSLQADYRFYFDSWGIVAHTVQLRYLVAFKDVTLRLRERFYWQKGADFYREHYSEVEPYMTTDRELSSFWSSTTGVKVSWRLPWLARALAADLKADVFYFRYADFALLPTRVGANLEAGLSLVY
jgi:hypothetical protein